MISKQDIPDEYLAELIQIRENFSRDNWRVGDITNALKILCAANHPDNPPEAYEIYRTVGQVVGKRDRTIRLYAETAYFYTTEIREIYSALPFAHFVIAKKYPDYARVLDLSQTYLDQHGITPSVEHLEYMLSHPESIGQEKPVAVTLPKLILPPIMCEESQNNPGETLVREAFDQIDNLMLPILNLLEKLTGMVPGPFVGQIAGVVAQIRKLREELTREQNPVYAQTPEYFEPASIVDQQA